MTNPELFGIRDRMCEYLSLDELEALCEVYPDFWNESLKRISLVKYLHEFGDMVYPFLRHYYHDDDEIEKVHDIIPGWNKAVKKAGIKSSLRDLEEIKVSLAKLLIEDEDGNLFCCEEPVNQVFDNAECGDLSDLKLVELLLDTSLDFSQRRDGLCYSYCGRKELVLLMIRSYINRGYDLDLRNINGKTPFHWACQSGNTKMVQSIISSSKDSGFELNKRDCYGHTPFHFACQSGSAELVQFMITSSKDYGFDLNKRDDASDETPFHFACSSGSKEVVQLLIRSSKDYGFILNSTDSYGETAFHSACSNFDRPNFDDNDRNLEVAKLIFENYKGLGIDITHQRYDGKTALDLVKLEEGNCDKEDWKEFESMLKEEYSKIDTLQPAT